MKPNLRRNKFVVIAALFITMFAMPIETWAQGTAKIILEAHNVWGDGSGYQLLLDADHNLYGDKIPVEGPIWDDNNPPANFTAVSNIPFLLMPTHLPHQNTWWLMAKKA